MHGGMDPQQIDKNKGINFNVMIAIRKDGDNL